MVYIVAVHVPIAGLALLPLMLGKGLILTPLIIALMEMVVDPACSIVLEAERAERNVMKRPPRDPHSPILTSSALLWGAVQGIISFIVLAVMWGVAHYKELPEDDVRSLLFVSLVFVNLSLILINRSFSASFFKIFSHKNPILGWGSLGMLCLFGSILFTPQLKDVFALGAIHFHDMMLALFSGVVLTVILEWIKPVFRSKAFS